MKVQADKKRTDRSFKPGDSVFIKLQPYVQTSVAKRANHKLAFRYFGPFPVKRAISPVAYELNLPATSKVHPVFHVSQLRQALTPGTTACSDLPIPSDGTLVPVEILNSRWRRTPSGRREQLLVHWSDPDILDATWEDALSLRHRFPQLPAWGQAAGQGGGNVSVPSKPRGRDGKNAAMAADSSTPAGKNDKWTNQGEGRVIARPTRIKQPNRRFVGPEWVNTT